MIETDGVYTIEKFVLSYLTIWGDLATPQYVFVFTSCVMLDSLYMPSEIS